jgi:hypothetical protein
MTDVANTGVFMSRLRESDSCMTDKPSADAAMKLSANVSAIAFKKAWSGGDVFSFIGVAEQ